MSILSDLDPKNSRIPANKSRVFSFSPWWFFVLPILLAAVVWWFYLTTAGRGDIRASSTDLPASLSEGKGSTPGTPIADSTATRTEEAVSPTKTDKGSALILNKESTTSSAEAPVSQDVVFQTAPEGSAADRPLSSAVSTTDETKVPKPAVTPVAKREPKKQVSKVGNTKKTNVAANRPSQDNKEKAKERDVDIISTLVR